MTDIEAEFADLAATHPGPAYTPMDRYRDYRSVFMGSDAGKRVLYDLLSRGHVFQSSALLGGFDGAKTLFFEGERNFALKLFATIRVEPKDPPKTQSKDSGN